MSESEPVAPQLGTWKCVSCFRNNWAFWTRCAHCGVKKPAISKSAPVEQASVSPPITQLIQRVKYLLEWLPVCSPGSSGHKRRIAVEESLANFAEGGSLNQSVGVKADLEHPAQAIQGANSANFGDAQGPESAPATSSEDIDKVWSALSKLESQICRDPSLPAAYKTICNEAFDAARNLDRLVKNLCPKHLAINLCSVGPCAMCGAWTECPSCHNTNPDSPSHASCVWGFHNDKTGEHREDKSAPAQEENKNVVD